MISNYIQELAMNHNDAATYCNLLINFCFLSSE